jgi:hypothetical protein
MLHDNEMEPMTMDRPVLYLDLDDTLLDWSSGEPEAAPLAREFVLWAAERFEIRWLTRWCRDGRMEAELLKDLCKMLDLEPLAFDAVQGLDWSEGDCKLNGIAWLEHLVLGRPFLWLEDETGAGERELRLLEEHGLRGAYCHCNVTRDADALARAWGELRRRGSAAAARAA